MESSHVKDGVVMSKFNVVVYNKNGKVEEDGAVYRTPEHEDSPFTFWVVKNGVYYASFDSPLMASMAVGYFEDEKNIVSAEGFVPLYFVLSSNGKKGARTPEGVEQIVAFEPIAGGFMRKFEQFESKGLEFLPEKFQIVLDGINRAASESVVKSDLRGSKLPASNYKLDSKLK